MSGSVCAQVQSLHQDLDQPCRRHVPSQVVGSVSSRANHTHANDRACCSLIGAHREALEELVFAEGPARVRYKLCTDLAKLCRPNVLHDSGEL